MHRRAVPRGPHLGPAGGGTHGQRPRGGGRILWLAVLGLALVVAGLALPQFRGSPGGGADTAPLEGGDPLPAYVVEPASHLQRTPRHPAFGMGAPRALVVPTLGVRAPVHGISVENRELIPPDDPRTLGWWRDGARPGALSGTTLITGHTVHSGGGAFDNLETLQAGDLVRVWTSKGLVRYLVSGVTVYRKASLARSAEEIFSQAVRHRLVLVTCEDWDGTKYLSNAVVFADPRPGQYRALPPR